MINGLFPFYQLMGREPKRQTADTFSAAAAFLEMCQIWASLEPEVTAKIKFAKYHALRIAKAIKAGEDPNLSNPVPEPPAELRTSPLSATDPEVQMLDPPPNATRIQGPLRQPSVVEIPDESEHFPEKLAQRSAPEYPSHPSRLPSHQHQSTGQDGAPLACRLLNVLKRITIRTRQLVMSPQSCRQ